MNRDNIGFKELQYTFLSVVWACVVAFAIYRLTAIFLEGAC